MLNETAFEKNDNMAPQRYVEVECHSRLTDLAMWPFCLIWDDSGPWILHMLRKQEVSYFKQTLPRLARVTGNKFTHDRKHQWGVRMGTFPSITRSAKCHEATSQEPVHGPTGLMEKETCLMKTRGLPSGRKRAPKNTRHFTLKHCENVTVCVCQRGIRTKGGWRWSIGWWGEWWWFRKKAKVEASPPEEGTAVHSVL